MKTGMRQSVGRWVCPMAAVRRPWPAPCGPAPAICAAVLTLAMVAAARAEHRLKYRWEPGDYLVYERRVWVVPLASEDVRRQSVEQVLLWCFENKGGEALVLVDMLRANEGQPESVGSAILHLHESGRRRMAPEVAARLDAVEPALDVLPVLPLPVQGETSWVSPPDAYQQRWRCWGRGPDAAQQGQWRVDFEVEDLSGVAEFLHRTRAGRFWFDTAAGRVMRFEAEERDEGRRERTRVAAVLRQAGRQSAEWAARRADETERYLRTLRHEDRLLAELFARPDDLARIQAQLDRLWSTLKSDVDQRAGSPFARIADGRRQQLRGAADRLAARAALGRRWLNHPARAWSLQDPAGQTLTSEAARPGVVIECFWSSDTIWGLRALESLRHVAGDPGRSPPPVLCYNLDFDVQQARRAIGRCGRGLRHVLAGPLQDVEGLTELPVVRVVDARGVVRGMWVGWDPSYGTAQQLARSLLAADWR